MRAITDKAAISLSLLCTIHCLVLPLLVVLLPSIAALPLSDEVFHKWMVIFVIPVSAYALTMGCKKHKRYRIFFMGSIGLIVLCVVAFFGHDLLGEQLEKVFTVIGTVIIATAHILNYRLCQFQNICTCPEQSDNRV